MPFYEYACVEHGTVITTIGSIQEDQPEEIHQAACELPGEEPGTRVQAGVCTYRRRLSTFSGRFGDTPRHHR